MVLGKGKIPIPIVSGNLIIEPPVEFDRDRSSVNVSREIKLSEHMDLPSASTGEILKRYVPVLLPAA
jgi:hypothetical protein